MSGPWWCLGGDGALESPRDKGVRCDSFCRGFGNGPVLRGGLQDTGMALGHSQSCLHPSPFPPAAPFLHGITRARQLLLQCHPSSIILDICNSAESQEGGKGERPDTLPASQPRCSVSPSLMERLLTAQTWPFDCYLCHTSTRRLRSKPSVRLAGVPTPVLREEEEVG